MNLRLVYSAILNKILKWKRIYKFSPTPGASLVPQSVKNLHAKQQTWILFLGQEDPMEKGMTTHSTILAWRIPWTGEPGRLQSMGLQRVGCD